jgi:phage N-6-adenine-methyltransferase
MSSKSAGRRTDEGEDVSEPRSLTTVSEATRMLAEAQTLDDVRQILDMAEAARLYARKAHLGLRAQNTAAAISIECQAKANEKIRAAREAGELASQGERTDLIDHADKVPTLADIDVSGDEAADWAKVDAVPEKKRAEYVAKATEAEAEVTRAGLLRYAATGRVVPSTAHLSSENDEWETPQDLFDELDAEFNFTLDVCASAENAKCERFFSENGLEQEWSGACWMNPPYSDVAAWMEKAYTVGQTGHTVVCLVPSRTDVGWFWDFARHGEVRFLRGRLHFTDNEDKTGPAPFPSAVVVFGRPASVVWYDR